MANYRQLRSRSRSGHTRPGQVRSHVTQTAPRVAGATPVQLQRRLGNRGTQAWLAEQIPVQRILMKDQQDEMYGRKAGEEEELLQGKFDPMQNQGPEEEEELLQGKFAADEAPAQFQGSDGNAENRTGMPGPLKRGLEQLSGMDLSGVRVHNNSSQPSQLNALAYTQGQDIHVAPGQEKHLPHEGWHTVQQMQGRVQPTMQAKGVSINDDAGLEREADVMGAKALLVKGALQATRSSAQQRQTTLTEARVQRKVVPEDVVSEMVGRAFSVTRAFTSGGVSLNAGDNVTVIAWSNASNTARVAAPAPPIGPPAPINVPKTLLRPIAPTVAGVVPYSAGVAGQAPAVEKSEKELAAWVAKESSYKTTKAVALFKKERKRLENLLKKRQEILNRRLIQETMFNRFDGLIKKEVDAANQTHGLTGKDALDPNLVKSMLFQETQLGTAGTHLEVPPSHPVKTRFNLGQVIDSSGLALMTLFNKDDPAMMSTSLPDMRKDLEAAQKERALLKKKTSLSSTESARLVTLDGLSKQNWEVFIWTYSSSASVKFADVVNTFFASKTPALNLDYGFWIHVSVMWLFEKRKPSMSWPEVIRSYNGSGARARHYRDAVVKRAAGAKAAEKAGTDFTPGKI
ncbi:MAG: DUF4157 domain-containing protein [bacterium]|nr:DUF4157 domain-containing protein [bacterium]